jgi:hypothetical protein
MNVISPILFNLCILCVQGKGTPLQIQVDVIEY